MTPAICARAWTQTQRAFAGLDAAMLEVADTRRPRRPTRLALLRDPRSQRRCSARAPMPLNCPLMIGQLRERAGAAR
jgi:hypothetical protein